MKIIAINASIQDIDALKDFFGAITHQNPAAVYIIVLSDAMPQSIAHFQHEIDLPSHLNIQQVGNYTRLHTNNVYLLNTQQNFIVKNQALMHDIGWNSDAASYKSTFWGTLAQHHGSNAIGVAMQPTLEHTTGLEQLIDVGGTLMLNADTMNNLESLSIAPIDFDYIHPANQLVSCITWRRDLPQASWAVPPMSSTNDFPSNQGTDFQTAADSNDWLHTPVAHTPKRTAFINHAIQNYLPTLIYLNQKGQVLSYLGNTLQFFPTIQKGQYITSILQNLSRESTSEVSDFTQSIHRMLHQSETSSVHVTHINADGTTNQIQIRISFDGKVVPNEITSVLQITVENQNTPISSHIRVLPDRNQVIDPLTQQIATTTTNTTSLILNDLDDLDESYRTSINELGTLNDDFNNVLQSTDISIVFVDESLRVRKFTNSVKQHFQVSNHIIGHSISKVPLLFECANFSSLVRQVITEETPMELEVKNQENWFSMRIHPYLTTENEVHGVMITFVNISEIRNIKKRLNDLSGALQRQGVDLIKTKVALQKMTIELEQKNNILKAILKAMPDTISRLDYAGKYLDYMPAQNEGNIPVAAFIGNYLKDIVPLNAIDEVLFAFKKTLKFGETQVANFQHYQNNMPQFYEARFAPIEQLDEVLCIIRNITDQIAAKDALQKSLAYYRLLIENTLTPLLTVRLDGTIIDLNKAALSLLKVPHKTALVHQNITSFLSKKSEIFQVKDLLKRVATDKLPESGRSFTIKDLNENQLELHVQGSVLELNRELVIQLSLQSITQTP